MLGLDSRVARYSWTVIAIFILVALIYEIRDTLFTFVIALFFAYLLWPLLKYLDAHLPGRSRTPALALVYRIVVGLLIFAGFEIGSRVLVEASNLAAKLKESRQSAVPPGSHSARQAAILEIQRQVAEHSHRTTSSLPA